MITPFRRSVGSYLPRSGWNRFHRIRDTLAQAAFAAAYFLEQFLDFLWSFFPSLHAPPEARSPRRPHILR